MPMKPAKAPRTRLVRTARTPRATAKLKFGPGKACLRWVNWVEGEDYAQNGEYEKEIPRAYPAFRDDIVA
jgi:hypothetical protein